MAWFLITSVPVKWMMMMNRKRRPIDEYKPAIKDWELEVVDDAKFPTMKVPGILQLVSEVDYDECKELLRAIVNLYISAKLQRQGVVEHWNRERKLIINYVRKEEWEWRIEILDVAKAYYHFEGRPDHKAIIEIAGNIVRYESTIQTHLLEL